MNMKNKISIAKKLNFLRINKCIKFINVLLIIMNNNNSSDNSLDSLEYFQQLLKLCECEYGKNFKYESSTLEDSFKHFYFWHDVHCPHHNKKLKEQLTEEDMVNGFKCMPECYDPSPERYLCECGTIFCKSCCPSHVERSHSQNVKIIIRSPGIQQFPCIGLNSTPCSYHEGYYISRSFRQSNDCKLDMTIIPKEGLQCPFCSR